MKKLLSALLCLLMIVGSVTAISASEKSIEKLSSETQVENVSKSYEIIYNEKPARVFYGSNGIDIVCEDETIHFTTSFPVLKLLPVGDVNGDGFEDFAVTEKSPDSADNLFIIDGSNGSVLNSTSITRMTIIENEYVEANTYALVMKQNGKDLLVVYDHTLLSYNCQNGEKNFEYVNKDNIWDIEVISDQIVFVDQLGQIGYVDANTGDLLGVNKISNSYNVTLRWDESTTITRNMNLWDLFYEDGMLYVTSEDGYLYVVDFEGNVQQEIFLNNFKIEDFINSLQDDIDWNLGGYVGKDVGLLDSRFKSFKVIDSNEKYILVGCYMIDEESLEKSLNYYAYQGIAVIDKETSDVYNQKYNSPDSAGVSACLTTYEENDAIVMAKIDSSKQIKLEYRDFEGNLLYQKNVDVITPTQDAFITIERNDDGYLIESYNSSVAYVSKDYKTTYAFDTVEVELVNLSDTITYLYKVNGVGNKLVNVQNDGKTINWEMTITPGSYKGIDYINVGDYNLDGVDDYNCLLQNYDKKGNKTDTVFLFVDGKTGAKILNCRIFDYKGYDEKGKEYKVYVSAEDFELIKDIDGDKRCEILVSGRIISSKSKSVKGSVDGFIDAKGVQVGIGDVNNDRIEDYIMLTDSKATVYVSKRKNYDYSFVKSSAAVTLNKNNKSNEYFTVIGDINNDGAKEIAFASKNKEGRQTFDIYDGKSLKKMFTLCPRGVSYYEVLFVLDIDINNDGYNELIHYSDSIGYYGLVDGKTGEVYKYFNLWEYNDISKEEAENYEIWHPDYMVSLEVPTENYSGLNLIKFKDVNGDGLDDYALIKQYTDYTTWKSYEAIFVYDAKTFEVLKTIQVETTDYISSIEKVEGSDDLLVLVSNDEIILQDITNETTIASYNIKCEKFSMINDTTILGMDSDKKLYLINIESGFELLTKLDGETSDHVMNLEWKNNSPYSVMSIYDNKELVYKGSEEQIEIRFTEGEHVLTFELDDGQGKNTIKSMTFTVTKQDHGSMYLVAVGGVALLIALAINMTRKLYIAKKVKGGLK